MRHLKTAVMMKPFPFDGDRYCSPMMEVFDEEVQMFLCISSEDVDWNEGEFDW